MLKSELVVFEAHLVAKGGVEIVDVDGFFVDVVGEVVGFVVDLAAFKSTGGHSHVEAAGVACGTIPEA